MAKRDFAPGFRCSVSDALILLAGLFFSFQMLTTFGSIGVRLRSPLRPLPAVAVALTTFIPVLAFFLFCNVFRVSRVLELIWAALYVGLMADSIQLSVPDWRISIAVSIVAMAIVICMQSRKPSYHGVGWQKINPGLPKWWETQQGKE